MHEGRGELDQALEAARAPEVVGRPSTRARGARGPGRSRRRRTRRGRRGAPPTVGSGSGRYALARPPWTIVRRRDGVVSGRLLAMSLCAVVTRSCRVTVLEPTRSCAVGAAPANVARRPRRCRRVTSSLCIEVSCPAEAAAEVARAVPSVSWTAPAHSSASSVAWTGATADDATSRSQPWAGVTLTECSGGEQTTIGSGRGPSGGAAGAAARSGSSVSGRRVSKPSSCGVPVRDVVLAEAPAQPDRPAADERREVDQPGRDVAQRDVQLDEAGDAGLHLVDQALHAEPEQPDLLGGASRSASRRRAGTRPPPGRAARSAPRAGRAARRGFARPRAARRWPRRWRRSGSHSDSRPSL